MYGIRRVGVPMPKKLRLAVTWAVALSDAPSRAWEVFFRQPEVFTDVCHPNRIRIDGARLVFDSDEEHLPAWMKYIDVWIASANERVVASLAVARGPEAWAPVIAGEGALERESLERAGQA